MKQRYLIDSRIFLDHLCGRKKATDWLINLKDGEAVITPRSRSEILISCNEHNQSQIQLMLDQYPCISVSKQCSDRAVGIWHKKQCSLDDAVQLALAKEQQLIFVTNAHKGFKSTKNKDVMIL